MQSKILLFDIEIAPNLGYTWGKYEQNVIKFVKEDYLLCFAYKWLGEKSVKIISQANKKEKDVIKALHDLFTKADIIVAHNGNAFDIKKANTYFIKHSLSPVSPFKSIDTLREAKKHFKFNSNKLDDLGQALGLGKKLNTGGFELWEGCMSGDQKAWKKMHKYNKQDVVLLEKVYLKLRGWTKSPRLALEKCPQCESTHTQSRGVERTLTGIKPRRHCQNCGNWFYGIKEKTYAKKA